MLYTSGRPVLLLKMPGTTLVVSRPFVRARRLSASALDS